MERTDSQDIPQPVELGSVTGDTLGAMGEMIEPVGFWQRTGIAED